MDQSQPPPVSAPEETGAEIAHVEGVNPAFPLPPHEDFDVTIIWHNMFIESSSSTFRKESRGPIERILAEFGKALSTGVFAEVYNVTATKNMFCVVLVCFKGWEDEDLKKAIFSVP